MSQRNALVVAAKMAIEIDWKIGRETQMWVQNLAAEDLDPTYLATETARLNVDINRHYGREPEEADFVASLNGEPDTRQELTVYGQLIIVLLRQLGSEPPEWMIPLLDGYSSVTTHSASNSGPHGFGF